jgi:methionyl-tRNA formyltransferase
MRIIFIGCVDFSSSLLDKVLALLDAEVVGVVTRTSSKFNADFCSLEAQAGQAGIPCFIDEGNRQADMAAWIAGLSPDVVYCFGWPYLLREDILKIPLLGVVGYHPTALPKNRGRHPIIWTLALGLTETASSFFFMDEGADTGDLLSQQKLDVGEDDDAETLYRRLKQVALRQVEAFTPLLASGCFTRVPQDSAQANYWRKRGRADGKIDWRMPARGIYNLVRALTKPYVGAHVEIDGQEIKVWRCGLVDDIYPEECVVNFEPGRVLAANAEWLDVRCGQGIVRLTKHEFQTLPQVGTYL